MHKAKAELTGKCYRLNKYQYGALKTQFALAIAGNTAVYYLIDFTLTCEKGNCIFYLLVLFFIPFLILLIQDCNMPNCNHPKSQRTGRNSLIELREYNLSYLRDRIALVFNSFVIAELCYQLESTFGVPSEFKSIDHGDTLPRTRNSEWSLDSITKNCDTISNDINFCSSKMDEQTTQKLIFIINSIWSRNSYSKKMKSRQQNFSSHFTI